jgi:hypothetical protein
MNFFYLHFKLLALKNDVFSIKKFTPFKLKTLCGNPVEQLYK